MPAITPDSDPYAGAPRSRWRRLGWFALLYAASLAAWSALAYLIRVMIVP
ncbi:MAG: DUF2474 domain-containing protein [Gammaproteobacteria bacterium]|nr:MAG: DUF2474 domain-containing protein [Gammaproteobacteria bacterium]